VSQYRPLSPDEINQTAADYYAARASKTRAQAVPSCVLIGGQPGAGKSAAGFVVRDELSRRGGYVHVDADRLREEIDTRGTRPTSEETQQDAGKLVAALRKNAIDGKRNILEEGTFRSPSGVAAFIDTRKKEGYQVELLAVATPREESLLGIFQRYEKQQAIGTDNPRFVPQTYHDEAMQGFEKTVVQNEKSFDRVRVIDRSGQVLYDSATPDRHESASAIQALKAGQCLSDEKLAAIGKSWELVKEQATTRRASIEYLDAVDLHAQRVNGMLKERIHSHAMTKLDTHFGQLRSDPRFAKHDAADLAKVAYFRGVHEKANAFKGQPPDFASFDAATSDRAIARSLPTVDAIEGHSFERGPARSAAVRDDFSL